MNCDYAIVSLHCHAIRGADDFIADYHMQDYAHACIDAGASAVIGHGTHVMQGIEIYKGKPIFYSLANFIYQIKYATRVPIDICETRGYDPEDVGADALFRKLAPGSLTANERYYKTMLPYFEFEGDKLTKLEILPIKVCRSEKPYNMAGVPLAADPSEIIEQLEYASKPYGTQFEIDGDIIRVKL
jgi:poly-gamma-glutamate synthesis protein (capsule biosynthesis protein)